MEVLHATSPEQYTSFDTAALRRHYLVEDLFGTPGQVSLTYSHQDRIILGGVRPDAGPVPLPAPEQLRSEHFCDRRELGVVNVGGADGAVEVDGKRHDLGHRECLYVGRGARDVVFQPGSAYYLISTPAHAEYPTVSAGLDQAEPLSVGGPEGSNQRTVYKYIHAGGIRSSQLVLGVTVLDDGSMWNTMPCHVHERRTEVYFYFDLPEDHRIVHLLGRPDETRHVVVANEQAVISPCWSVHSGFGTRNYAFVWAMGGENQAYDDMDVVAIPDLR